MESESVMTFAATPEATAPGVTYFPDISSKQAGMALKGLGLVIVKATQGAWYYNPAYGGGKTAAEADGVLFAAYHYLENGNAGQEAAWCYNHVGPDVPLMVDAETNPANNTGPSYAYVAEFINAYRKLGGKTHLLYLPRWYWHGQLGAPVMSGLGSMFLATSDYTALSTGDGWKGYGGLEVATWQYTDSGIWGSTTGVDTNAYRGTLAGLYRLMLTGSPVEVPATETLSVTARLVIDAGWAPYPDADHYVVKADGNLITRTTGTHLEGQVIPLHSTTVEVYAIDAKGQAHSLGSRDV